MWDFHRRKRRNAIPITIVGIKSTTLFHWTFKLFLKVIKL